MQPCCRFLSRPPSGGPGSRIRLVQYLLGIGDRFDLPRACRDTEGPIVERRPEGKTQRVAVGERPCLGFAHGHHGDADAACSEAFLYAGESRIDGAGALDIRIATSVDVNEEQLPSTGSFDCGMQNALVPVYACLSAGF